MRWHKLLGFTYELCVLHTAAVQWVVVNT